MTRSKEVLMQNRSWLLAVAVVAGLSLWLAFASGARAEQKPQLVAGGLAQSQIFNDDLTVGSEQAIEGDVVVYSGDATVKRGGKIDGTLTVYSGDVEVAEGGAVAGNITAWSGDVKIDGRVDGSIAAMSGDIELGNKAIVGGDISSMSGRIKQRAGADVGGSVLHGPNLKLPVVPGLQSLPWAQSIGVPMPALTVRPLTFGERLLGFFGRVLMALLVLGLAVVGAAGLMALRSPWVMDVHGVLNRQTALSFATGLLVNVLLLSVVGFLYITVCLRPPGLLLGLGLAALNVAGWAAVGNELGGRLNTRFGKAWDPAARTAVGVLAPGALIVFLWMLGGCFAFFAYLGALLISSFGVGAVLVKVLNLGSNAPGAPAGSSAPAPVAQPAASAPAVQGAGETPGANTPAVAPVAPAPSDAEVTALMVVEAASPAPMPAAPVGIEADFTSIPGIGPKLSQRLKEAGVRTFADLAAQSPEALAAILGWSVERVTRSDVIEQAQVTAAAGQ